MSTYKHVTKVLLLLSMSLALQAQSPEPQPAFTYPTPPSPGHYKAPPLSLAATYDDPAIQKLSTHLYTGDVSGFQSELKKLAESGNPSAQLMLGEWYVPRETYARLSPAGDSNHGHPPQPKIVPATDTSLIAKLFPPSYSQALKWLTLASAQGSGEASEIIAQIITRILDEHKPSTFTLVDAVRYRNLAVQQGYDLENVTVRCLGLTHNTQKLTCSDANLPGACPTPDEMHDLRATGLTGALEPEGGASGSLSTISMHPTDPPARALIILDHNIDTEQRLPLPRHASAIYVQQANGWLTLPKGGPVLDRDIVLTPGNDALNAVMAYVQDIDGSYSGGSCVHSIGPFPR